MTDNIIKVDFALFAVAQQLNLREQDELGECQVIEFNREEERMDKYPEHEKLAALDGANQLVGEVIDWLAETHEVRLPFETEKLIAEFFGLDLEKLEAEQKIMLTILGGDSDDSTTR